ncbi:hypothetical protein RI578_20105 [Streptomyces sp. BB1-1-1]|uniref:hypothetical protein n=1 Tax=Streptomyces sp. BB1-1-1 TaxID=3074430 RepID=UPI002877DF9D|nr:hypothetical protein [Streptomyces sp. BB1-1-1]WND36447.1 hypothetical protein RI578_20105 [Streptomyces sp. BB1-1-1]
MAKHWIVASLPSAGGAPHLDVITTEGDGRPSGQEIRAIIGRIRGPVAQLWEVGPLESQEAAAYSAERLRDLTNFAQVTAEQAATFQQAADRPTH